MIDEFTDYPNDYYKKFFDKFKEIETLQTKDFKPIHLIAYFCKKYKQQYNINFKFKFNTPQPSKCFEMFQVKKLGISLTTDPTLLKDYIDWVFANKVKLAKKRLTSISFLNNEEHVTFYKINVLLNTDNNKVSRTTLLPVNYKNIFDNAGFNLNTYGDLSFLSQMNPMPNTASNAFNDIKMLGFDDSILTKII